ncbi:unnamed protein product [Agarophyton chilense]
MPPKIPGELPKTQRKYRKDTVKNTSSSASTKRSSPTGSSSSHAKLRATSSSSATSQNRNDDKIPYSLKDAPAELRPAIKRKQNREHARRSRERKRTEEEKMTQTVHMNASRIRMLETQIQVLTEELFNGDKQGASKSERSPNTEQGFYGDPF